MRARTRLFLGLGFVLLALIRVDAQSYDSELHLGVVAYRENHYEEAIEHFRKASALDPSQSMAHLYLATTYTSQYIPGVAAPDNQRLAEQAIEQYQLVLDSNASPGSRINSAKGIASLYFEVKNFEESRKYYQMASDIDPKDPENYYSLGVIDWTRSYQARMEARAKIQIRPDEQLNAADPEHNRVCEELRGKSATTIEDGISNLKRAIELRPDYDDAMAYLNLMFRERADLECDDPAGRQQDLKTADRWVDKTLAVKKAKARTANPQSAPTEPNRQ
jgi:tetratricopeptide (TPR) repeat protein